MRRAARRRAVARAPVAGRLDAAAARAVTAARSAPRWRPTWPRSRRCSPAWSRAARRSSPRSPGRGLRGIVIVARGSSDYAAVFGRYLLEAATGMPVALAAPSLQTLYGVEPRVEGWLAIAISQSGRTPEIATVLERFAARRRAHDRDHQRLRRARSPPPPSAHVALDAGPERAVPATKTFTAELAAMALIAEALGAAHPCPSAARAGRPRRHPGSDVRTGSPAGLFPGADWSGCRGRGRGARPIRSRPSAAAAALGDVARARLRRARLPRLRRARGGAEAARGGGGARRGLVVRRLPSRAR